MTDGTITARALNRCTLARQLLLKREAIGVADAVRRVVALQAQQPASPYVGLWNRIVDFDPADLDLAFARHEVVKAPLMRATLHAVHADDYRCFREAMEPVLRRASLDSRFTATGVTVGDADLLVPHLLGYARQPRSSGELRTWLEHRLGVPLIPRTWQALRSYAPMWHAPVGSAPWSFGPRASYVAARPRPSLTGQEVAAAATKGMVSRYLAGFGPASLADLAQFAKIPRARVRAALTALGDDLEQLDGPDGVVLYDVPGGERPDPDAPAPPRLMPMWDSTLLAYADRSRVVPPDLGKIVTRPNGDVLPTLLVDGYIAGVWRAVEAGIEATAFRRLPDEAWDGLAAEARSLLQLLAHREPAVYSRYDHWWSKLPSAEARLLPAA